MTKQEILSRLEPCLDKALLDEIKAVFEREEKMAQFMKNMKDAFTACTDEKGIQKDPAWERRKQIMQEEREYSDCKRGMADHGGLTFNK